MAQGVCELLWLQTLLKYLGLVCDDPMKLYYDNKAAIDIDYDQIKHVEIDHHFIKEKLKKGLICMPPVKSGDQLANVLTKDHASRCSHSLVCKLGMKTYTH